MASFTLKTESVDYGGGRGGRTLYNTIDYSISGNRITFSYGGQSGASSWTLYASSSGTNYAAILEIQVNYGSGWATLVSKSRAIPTVAQGGLDIIAASEDMIDELGTQTLSGACEMRALYYANRAPAPTSQYPYAFPNESYASSSQTPIDVSTSPSGGYINMIVPGTNSFTLTGGVSDMGLGSQTYAELVVLTAPYTQAGIPQLYEGFYSLSATKTITNNSSTSAGGLTISPNTTYYLGVWADNGYEAYRYNKGSATTLAEAATVSVGEITESSIQINWSTSADGGVYNKEVQYSLDGGNTWTTGATISGGSAQSSSFTISNLTSSTQYSIQTRVHTTAGNTSGTTLSVTTGSAGQLYGPAPTPVYIATELTNNSGFNAITFMSKWESTRGVMLYSPTMLTTTTVKNMTEVRVRLDKGGGTFETKTIFLYTTGSYSNEGAEWGFASEPQNGYFTSVQETRTLSKKVVKLYGSVMRPITTVIGVIEPTDVAGNILAFDGDVFWVAAKNTIEASGKTPDYLSIDSAHSSYGDLMLHYTDGTVVSLASVNYARYGLTLSDAPQRGSDYVHLTMSTSTQNVATLIKKLYGSVNGQTKLIYEG